MKDLTATAFISVPGGKHVGYHDFFTPTRVYTLTTPGATLTQGFRRRPQWCLPVQTNRLIHVNTWCAVRDTTSRPATDQIAAKRDVAQFCCAPHPSGHVRPLRSRVFAKPLHDVDDEDSRKRKIINA